MPPIRLMGGISFSLKLEGQDWQCIFHAFLQGAGRITHALPLGAGRHGFSCTSPCFQFIMEDWRCPDNFLKNVLALSWYDIICHHRFMQFLNIFASKFTNTSFLYMLHPNILLACLLVSPLCLQVYTFIFHSLFSQLKYPVGTYLRCVYFSILLQIILP